MEQISLAGIGTCRRDRQPAEVPALGTAETISGAGVSVVQLLATTPLDAKLVKAIVDGNYTPSPSQR
jgi:hypothetical protein